MTSFFFIQPEWWILPSYLILLECREGNANALEWTCELVCMAEKDWRKMSQSLLGPYTLFSACIFSLAWKKMQHSKKNFFYNNIVIHSVKVYSNSKWLESSSLIDISLFSLFFSVLHFFSKQSSLKFVENLFSFAEMYCFYGCSKVLQFLSITISMSCQYDTVWNVIDF